MRAARAIYVLAYGCGSTHMALLSQNANSHMAVHGSLPLLYCTAPV